MQIWNLEKRNYTQILSDHWRAFEPSSLVSSWRIHGVLKWWQHSHLGASTLLVARSSIIHPSSWAILLSFLSSLLIPCSSLLSCCLVRLFLFFQHLFFSVLCLLISLCSVQIACHPFLFGVFQFYLSLLIQFDNMRNIQMSLGFGTSFWWVLVLEHWSNSKKSA